MDGGLAATAIAPPPVMPSRPFAALHQALGTVLSVAVTVLGLVSIVFLIGRLLPTDPVLAIIGQDATQDTYERVFRQLRLDRPVWEQYLHYLRGIAVLDFGTSFLTGNPVAADIARVLPATVELGLTAVLLGGPVGVLLGVLAAVRQDTWFDHAVRLLGLLAYSTPSFLKALLALLVFYYALGWTEGPGRVAAFNVGAVPEITGFIGIDAWLAGEPDLITDWLGHLVLPLSVLAVANAAWFSRFCRTFTLEELGKEYVLVARGKGMAERLVIWRHVFRNIRVQLITISAVALASSLEGSVLVETVFAWPGFGQYFVHALSKGDMNAVIGCTTLIGLFFVSANLVAERLFRLVDRRTR